jgi:hypothetical protein
MRKFTQQMIAGATHDEGTYCLFHAKKLALSLMLLPNANAKCKKKQDVVKIFEVSPEGGLVTFTCEIFGIPLSKSSPYSLHHCLVDVVSEKRACYATGEAAIFAACTRGVLEFPFKRGKMRNGVPIWVDQILPLEQQSDAFCNYCCLLNQWHKKMHMEKPVIDPSFIGILSFCGCDQVLSALIGRDIDYQDFNLSSLH